MPGNRLLSTKNVFRPNNIFYGKLRPYLNKVYLATESGICSTDILVLECAQKKILLGFGAFYLLSDFVLKAINNMMGGANLPRVDSKALLQLDIPLPPLAEQKRFVEILDAVGTMRILRQEADKRTRSLLAAVFREMFGSPAVNPKKWPIETVGDLLDESRGGVKCGPFGSVLKKNEYTNSGVPVWGIGNVLPNQFVEDGSLFITRSKYDDLSAYSVESGDLLISRAGTVGRICVARPEIPDSIIGTNLIRLRLDRKRVVSEFFSSLLTEFSDEIGSLRTDSGEGAYSFMNTRALGSLKIYVPPLKLQQIFADRMGEIRKLEAWQCASQQSLAELFGSLLYRVFGGNI